MKTNTPRTDALKAFQDKEYYSSDYAVRLHYFEGFARELERENAALREERDSYRLRAEQNWGLRKEIQSALNVPYDYDGEEALKQGLAAIKTLRADKERMDWLQASAYWPFCYSEFEESSVKPLDGDGRDLRAAIDAARKEAKS
jgi:hypothetical protein